ncbi:uncharacterized protein PV07_11068 [Cladophialophora immunda]|uniref:Enoyl reductase (ER) domain-containing protein n=1 Tax=Cladophialophora immunda TaxID=569365 RepID=A0A0D2AD60_9EURO|nr:uncharacterized protein PV07_11068 [Cladophialophora immunda]KIW22807.1 hypothetical protein PV07_11068 [Cladophialophora immunda]
MSMARNSTFIFKQAPRPGWPLTEENLAVETRTFDLGAAPPLGGFTIAHLFFSLDPGLRLRMVSSDDHCYMTPFEEGQTIPETSIARVLKSDCPIFRPGDLVIGFGEMEEYSAIRASAVTTFQHIQNPYLLPLTAFLGPLGIPGLTAYSSLFAIGKPVAGETIYVSAAAGGVGQVVGQLAKVEGLKVIGSVGSDEKLDIIKRTLHFDDGFNYKEEDPTAALKRLAPEGIDIFYDNVGGEALDAALLDMKCNGRIVSCGCASQYTRNPTTQYRLANLLEIPARRLTMQGFIVFDQPMLNWSLTHETRVGRLLAMGQMVSQEDIVVGMDKAVEAFLGVLSGRNVGKAILQVSEVSRTP